MPTSTYVALGTITLASTDSEIVFSSIPATYRDLIVVGEFTHTGTAEEFRMRLNSDSGSNYSKVQMNYYTAGVSSGSDASQSYIALTYVDGVARSQFKIQVFDYAQTDKHKTILSQLGNTTTSQLFTSYLWTAANRWASTAATTSLSFTLSGVSRSFQSGSTFSLYGVN